MRLFLLLITAWGLMVPAAMAGSRPVVVELFTSQGCSSCPPADALMAELAPRDDVIGLALHVDYWDYIGWKDTFGNSAFSERQKNYARVAGERTVFTPQMVVEGQDHVIGYEPMKLAQLIANHAADTGNVEMMLRRSGATVIAQAESKRRFQRPALVHLVRYMPVGTVQIKRGENAGKEISYHNIVTSWETVGKWDGREPLDLRLNAPGNDPVVVLIQLEGPREILAAARLR